MAKLIKCKDCGHEVSKKASTCPQCGAPTKPKSVGCGGAIVLIIAAVIVFGIVSEQSDTTVTAKAPKTPQEIRREKVESQFSAWDGSHRSLEKSIEKSLKDPDSYEHIETTFADKGEYILVRTRFRARNSFGGFVVQTAEGKYDINGNSIEKPVMLE